MQQPVSQANAPTLIAVIRDDAQPGFIELQLHVPENLPCFKGHFPSFQILPGVVQLKWVVDFAKEFLALDGAVNSIERLKFTSPIQPNMLVHLRIQFNANAGCAEFRFYNTTQSFAQGRLHYE